MNKLPLTRIAPPRRPLGAGPAPAKVAVKGLIASNRQIVRKERDNTETVLEEAGQVDNLEADSPAHTGMAGINLGLTIPGPKGSYMTARIDVFGYVPALPSDEGMRAGFARISNLAQERLEMEVDEAREALGV